ncbi:hypothetical protein CDO22_17695 [Sinorhizobium meliloti]|uniref:hypothetical protein n=1 Tax=Rhizobium meliloti TaxID=382 RepID=UPI000B4A0614|nr:hypothetical protein [Sinorhizobium meliloti]ASQ11828.1 hypothetical protein CDO22_17695 [Sinorhizobium meliloti]MQU83589.1 hypothetical protein [Sinorhizobium meliloti]
MLKLLLSLFSGPLDRILDTVDHRLDNETAREEIRTRAVTAYVEQLARVQTSRWGWAPLLFYIPVGFWFGSVCVYSVLFCRVCAFPQEWAIAALPPSLDPWIGAIIGSLFIGKAGETILRSLRR